MQYKSQAFALFFAASVLLVPARADVVDDIVRAEMDRQHIPGLALAIVKPGEPVRMQGFGLANLEHDIPVTPRTVFKIGSVSKQFIAAGILLLADEGKLSLDDSVRKFLTDAPEAWEGVTIRQLLSHTGGLIREGPGFNSFRVQPDIDVVRSAYAAPVEFKPGEKWQYSNIAYFAAGEIISRVSGTTWEAFLSQRIFQPLAMKASRATTAFALVPNRSDGYVWQNGNWVNATEFLAVRPSGAFLASLEDLMKWDAALGTDLPLKRSIRKQMWTAVLLNDSKSSGYGLGWHIGANWGKRSASHGGTMTGFRSHYVRLLDDGVSVIVLTNLGSANPQEIVSKIMPVVLGTPASVSDNRNPAGTPEG
jgi:CubicO group peptidase (beta-lactamase class C family)